MDELKQVCLVESKPKVEGREQTDCVAFGTHDTVRSILGELLQLLVHQLQFSRRPYVEQMPKGTKE